MDSLIDGILERALATDCFGKGVVLLNYEKNSAKESADHFASDISFYRLDFEKDGERWSINVIIKIQPRSEKVRDFIGAKGQFRNEALMYEHVLPFLDKDGVIEKLFGKLYCAYLDPGSDDSKEFLILEDLSILGYQHTSEKVFLDYDHCALVMKHIGMFHALSYAAKHEGQGDALRNYTNKFILKQTEERLNMLTEFFYLCGKRGVDPIIEEGTSVELLSEFLRNYNNFPKFYFSLIEPVEPEAVVCHGDFCRNNMFFKYDSNGRPVSVKFYDLQTPVYTSPAIDLSFFLLMNTNQKLRDEHWDDLMLIYRNAIFETIPGVKYPDLDFGRVGIYGYLHCSFFLPCMMNKAENSDLESQLDKSPHEVAIDASTFGGEEATKAIADIIRHLAKRNYIRSVYY